MRVIASCLSQTLCLWWDCNLHSMLSPSTPSQVRTHSDSQGTTSLVDYLSQHVLLKPKASRKEYRFIYAFPIIHVLLFHQKAQSGDAGNPDELLGKLRQKDNKFKVTVSYRMRIK